ncbi:hypothetical protein BGX28_005162 [Mortierella sp. GBA30]|nr:hypothetical protein BGX28_005162 [Mortierella sp. GBA30]
MAAVQDVNRPPVHLSLFPNAYLFEFGARPRSAAAAQEIKAFRQKIASMKSVRIRQVFDTLLNGISAQVEDHDELRELMAMKGLLDVTPITIVPAREQVQPTRNALVTSALNMTGVTRAHAELGLSGKGIKVGVIDTGVDWTHPALGGCFGPGCRVAYGWDFVGDQYTGKNSPVPGKNPMDCAGHGSHVAGIIGASDNHVLGVAPQVTLGAYRVLGCSGSSNDDVILAALERAANDKMNVINLSIGEPNGWPYNPVSRAISKLKSLGIMVAVSHGNENTQGLFSANYVAEGPSVLGVASFINTRVLLSYFTLASAPDSRILYAKSESVPGLNSTMPLVAPINGTELGQGCEPHKKDLSGKAQNALDRGAAGIMFVNNVAGSLMASIDPIQIASGSLSQDEGGKVFEMMKSNSKGAAGAEMTGEVLASFSATPAAFVNPAGGSTSLFSSYGLDNELHIKPDIGAPGENIYSTWPMKNGSYMTLSGTSMASPHIAGALALALEQIQKIAGYSSTFTWPQIERVYDTFKNTAEPAYVFRNHAPYEVLSAATVPTVDDDKEPGKTSAATGDALIDSVAKQGSGMVNVFRALSSLGYGMGSPPKNEPTSLEESSSHAPISMTFVTPSSLELNDTEFATTGQPHIVTIYNYGPTAIQYELSHLPAESLHELSIESKQVKTQNMDLYNVTKPTEKDKDDVMFAPASAVVEFPIRTFSVPAGGNRRVAINILPPVQVPLGQHWIYSGYILIRAVSIASSKPGASTDVIHVPYAGVSGRMKSLPIFLRPTEKEVAANNQTLLCQVLGTMDTNKPDLVYTLTGEDFPVLSFCIANPTRFLILDLISGLDAAESVNEPQDSDGSSLNGKDFKVIGRVASNEFVPRSMVSSIVTAVQWDGTLDLTEGHDGNNTKGMDTKAGGREIIHREPGMDLIYGMNPRIEGSGGQDSSRVLQDEELGHHYRTGLIQRDLAGDDREGYNHVEDALLSKKGHKKHRHTSPEDKKSRNQHLLSDAHKNPDGGKIPVPDGRYRLRLRALRILGDINSSEDYDSWITRTFTIQRAKEKETKGMTDSGKTQSESNWLQPVTITI